MLRLKRGDNVQVIAGAEKGKQGQILRIDHRDGRLIVQGVNLVYKHLRRSQKYPQGGRIQKEGRIHISNVMLVDPTLNQPVRIRVSTDENGKRTRVSARSGEAI